MGRIARLQTTIFSNDISTEHINLLPKDIAEGNSKEGYGTYGAFPNVVNTEQYMGDHCVRITGSNVGRCCYYYILPLLTQGKYYLASVYIKVGNPSWASMYLSITGDSGSIFETEVTTKNTYIRKGALLKPKDYDTATSIHMRFGVGGTDLSEKWVWIDNLMVNEVTAEDYSYGIQYCLNKYAWKTGV